MTGQTREHSGSTTFGSGDSGTAQDVVSIRNEETFSVETLLVTYSSGATTNAIVVLYDELEGTAYADVSDEVATLQVGPGDKVTETDLSLKDVEDDVVATVDGNDGDVSIVAGGEILTG